MEHERFSGQMRPINYTMNVRGELIDLSHPSVMGILNVTPDSFYANSRMQTEAEIYNRTNQIMEEGATIIDVGACSTRPGRPGGEVVDEEEEMRRLAMALPIIRKAQPNAIISIDTFRASVARKTVEEFGADIINDVEEGADPDMFRTVADLGVPYILMSKAANLHDMLIDFAREVQELRNLGQKDIILDPGFGFGKEPVVNGNYALMGVLERLHTLELPILVGISRKRIIHQLLGITAKESLNGTTVLNVISLMKGASILRVHDVKEAVEAVKIYDCLVANTPKEEGF
jgi:dihydropteroate synthase